MITISSRDLEKFQRVIGHIKGAVPKAVSAALNRALHRGRTELSKATRAAFTIRQKDLFSTLSVKSACPANLNASLVSRHPGMWPLYDFNVRPKGLERRREQGVLASPVRTGR